MATFILYSIIALALGCGAYTAIEDAKAEQDTSAS